MLMQISADDFSAFVDRKKGQWERVQSAIPMLQMVRSGERGSQFVIGINTGAIQESVIYGQLPHVFYKIVGRKGSRVPAENADKPVEMRSIDLTDAQIDAVLARWASGKSALNLPGVDAVFDGKGRLVAAR